MGEGQERWVVEVKWRNKRSGIKELEKLHTHAQARKARAWFVSRSGFSADAIQYAIDSPANRLISVDPAALPWRKLDKMTEELMTAINNRGANPPISWDNLFEVAAIVNAPPDNKTLL